MICSFITKIVIGFDIELVRFPAITFSSVLLSNTLSILLVWLFWVLEIFDYILLGISCLIISYHCVKSVRMQSFPGPYFKTFGLNMERVSRVYSSSLLGAIIARNHLPFFKIFSDFIYFSTNFQIFCPFSEKSHACSYFLE